MGGQGDGEMGGQGDGEIGGLGEMKEFREQDAPTTNSLLTVNCSLSIDVLINID